MDKEPLLPAIEFKTCPIKASLGVLGRKWTMLILRDIGFRKIGRFNELLRSVPGLTPRVLSTRLSELEADGIIVQVETREYPKLVRWGLTKKGESTLPILMSMIEFGSRWYAGDVFEDKVPRAIEEIFPQLPFERHPATVATA
ncbi:MAG: helix-turn-helix transcriptional regulator [Thaumarchaeota archaeon]|nr:helix-turn-helix transcriptional regulator [Nitrososphaerota archaeon]